ncbi:peroxiredoxin [Pseudoxanthomonas japonensis]|uniref:thioredoxin-dependent peroxiredoxin n=1 Tax=Pseudoxanthomonas japonensis TaxID=69284 RepID=A0ABQ6ZK87_9GAMM|nr:peroxiredoxin [Pseudoxanthomonas japonensis]KAF1726618.1 peroxiredoxin [Pseudoxanthomonas japonensis]
MTAKSANALPKSTLKLPLALSGGEHSPSAAGATTLADYAGTWLVLYFYPKDSTPGCTTEGLDFNALLPKFKKLNATVLGVSRDSVKSHDNFCAKQGFKFPLVSDADEALCKAFDVIHEKNMYGRKVLGVVRSTFLISPDGRIAQEWRGVKVPGHADAVLDALKAHQAQ